MRFFKPHLGLLQTCYIDEVQELTRTAPTVEVETVCENILPTDEVSPNYRLPLFRDRKAVLATG
jgi:hypothetical protein